ncbi:unnamed protein product, partial [Didymodactylos carnosus]
NVRRHSLETARDRAVATAAGAQADALTTSI